MIVYIQHREVVWDHKPAVEQYGHWSKKNNFIIDGVTLDTVHRWGYTAIASAVAYNVGDPIWVLWMEYSQGDSLGSETGNGEIIWVFESEISAESARQACIAAKDRAFTFKDDDGEEIHLCNPVDGDYFASVSGIFVKEFIVGECPPSTYEEEHD